MTATLQDEQLTLLGEIITMIHQTTTGDGCRKHVVHRTLAQWMNEFHDVDQLLELLLAASVWHANRSDTAAMLWGATP